MPKKVRAKAATKPRPFEDEWTVLLTLSDCLPKTEFPFRLRRIAGNLYQFAEHGYASVRRLTYVKDAHPPKCLRVANVFWARNEYAARVMARLHGTIDRRRLQAGKAVPPDDLLRGMATSWTNADTYQAARRLKSAIPERASYDWTQFLYKTVSLPRLEVIYASRLKKDSELPIAVEVLLNRAK